MSTRVDDIVEQAMALSSEARAELTDRLVETLDPSEASPNHDLWVQEARSRLAELRNGSVTAIPGEAAMEELRRKHVG